MLYMGKGCGMSCLNSTDGVNIIVALVIVIFAAFLVCYGSFYGTLGTLDH